MKNIWYINPYYILWLMSYSSLIVLFFFIIKGVWVGYKRKLDKKFIIHLPIIIVLLFLSSPIVFVVLPPICYAIKDIIGLGFFSSLAIFAMNELEKNNFQKDSKVVPTSKNYTMKSRYSHKEKIFIFITAVLLILGLSSFSLIRIIVIFLGAGEKILYIPNTLANPFWNIWFITWLCILLLSFLTIKGIYTGNKKHFSNKYFYISFIIWILLIVIYYPFSNFYLNIPNVHEFYVILDVVGIIFSFLFLINAFHECV
ncbi:MAG TPA: hypothetical protein QF753_14735 [Victivallales bacterium]|nr:hypothetical protein [Victivallales bacterium]